MLSFGRLSNYFHLSLMESDVRPVIISIPTCAKARQQEAPAVGPSVYLLHNHLTIHTAQVLAYLTELKKKKDVL